MAVAMLSTEMLVKKYKKKYEPRHDKTNIVRMWPAWIQTSLRSLIRIHAVRFPTLLQVEKLIAYSMNPDQIARMLVANAICWFCRDAAQIMNNMGV
jgi:hypothetical protein